MRDLIKIAAAGTVMAAYALLAPSLVEAVPGATGSAKVFTQRLPQAGGTVPVSARIDGEAPIPGQVVVTRRPLLVGISTGETSR
ncbi:hypothetical protein ABEV34_03130 [Methylorubrum rhodesianum]|jgi:hypothetical protein|uniref:Uncharacterized protein n=1 Tax=Methylorubrum rhodesianum TaxID=29427 RepID=A0ABU9ZBH6_9HYPH|nr:MULTISPECIES: hypothetical protein [Methylorubrum]MBB5763911.1 hypothetical protein [Methylorubrum rhodesianum]MBI1690342.1 hypothetical protein [Methylorubrum sp. DB1722]MBK3401565.1 hypothetical protein [Methylorubrum rhodesianum]MBY0141978.1 hypothetical protein [Methylorubrum populi]